MKNLHKGFIVPLLIIIIAVLAIGCGVYVYQKNKKSTQEPVIATASVTPTTSTTSQQTTVTSGGEHFQPSNVISSLPEDGQVFTLGGVMIVQWDPSKIAVSTMYLKNVYPANGKAKSYQIYRRDPADVYSNSASTQGLYQYEIPTDYSVDPGQYQIELDSYGETQKILMPNKFQIQAPKDAAKKSPKSYYINSVVGYPSYDTFTNPFNTDHYYSPSSGPIAVMVDAREADGTVAIPQNGFNVQGHVSSANGAGISTANAVFDSHSNLWNITNLQIPTAPGSYLFKVQLYCGQQSLNSVCAQKYGVNADQESTFTITVVSN